MRLIITVMLLAILAACVKTAEGPAPTTNAAFDVEKLFTTPDGCTVFRFYDAGGYRYLAHCGTGVPAQVDWQETCGKNCTRAVTVPTGSDTL